jgi:hypothetical protein
MPIFLFLREYLCVHTVLTECAIISIGLPTLSSDGEDHQYSCVCSQSAMRQDVSHFVDVTDKVLSTVLVGRANGPNYCLLS